MPTGISVAIQDDRSHKNRAKASEDPTARLREEETRRRDAALAEKRRVARHSCPSRPRPTLTASLCPAFRPYRLIYKPSPKLAAGPVGAHQDAQPQQGRVTDHRCGLTLHSLDQVLRGARSSGNSTGSTGCGCWSFWRLMTAGDINTPTNLFGFAFTTHETHGEALAIATISSALRFSPLPHGLRSRPSSSSALILRHPSAST